jgi:hypothetical protein
MSQCVSRNCPGIFGIFRIFSMALLIYLDISGFIFAQENIPKKTFLFYLGRARRPDPHPLRPSLARWGPLARGGHGLHGQRRRRHLGVRAVPALRPCNRGDGRGPKGRGGPAASRRLEYLHVHSARKKLAGHVQDTSCTPVPQVGSPHSRR